MDLALASWFCPTVSMRAFCKMRPYSSNLNCSPNVIIKKNFSCSPTVATDTTWANEYAFETKKHNLLRATQDKQRGLGATPDQSSIIEEALVIVEGYNRGEPFDLVKLDGTWRLQYTSAPDVLVLLEAAARIPIFQGRLVRYFRNSNAGISLMEVLSAMLFNGVSPPSYSLKRFYPPIGY